jgi:hypothetical protein
MPRNAVIVDDQSRPKGEHPLKSLALSSGTSRYREICLMIAHKPMTTKAFFSLYNEMFMQNAGWPGHCLSHPP